MNSEEFGKYIRTRINDLDIDITDVAKRMGVSRPTLYDIMDGSIAENRLSMLIRLANALEINPIYLIRKAIPEINELSTGKTKHEKDYSGFVRDVTFPDDSNVTVNQEFEKIWEIHNLGDVVWENRRLKCCNEELISLLAKRFKISAKAIGRVRKILNINENKIISEYQLAPLESEVPIPDTKPGDTVQIKVIFRAPKYPCTVISYWKMVDEKGNQCFSEMRGVHCKVKVQTI